MDRHALIQSLEVELHRPDVRRDAALVRSYLHDDFVEIGRSGRFWTSDDIAASIAASPERSEPPVADEWRFVDLSETLVLVTYRLQLDARTSRHSSLWEATAPRPLLRFHQGTVAPT